MRDRGQDRVGSERGRSSHGVLIHMGPVGDDPYLLRGEHLDRFVGLGMGDVHKCHHCTQRAPDFPHTSTFIPALLAASSNRLTSIRSPDTTATPRPTPDTSGASTRAFWIPQARCASNASSPSTADEAGASPYVSPGKAATETGSRRGAFSPILDKASVGPDRASWTISSGDRRCCG